MDLSITTLSLEPRGGNYHYIDDKDIRATRFEGKFGEFVKTREIQVFE